MLLKLFYFKRQNQLTQEVFYKNQEKVKEISFFSQEIKSFDYKVNFSESTEMLKRSTIGSISYNQKNYLLKRLKSMKPKVIEIDCSPYSLCILPSNNLLVSDFNNNRLLVYDKNFVLIRTIATINNQVINAVSLETNQKDRIYIGNYSTNTMISVDLNFKLMQTFGSNISHQPAVTTINNNNTQFLPFDIKFYENFLFICDFNNKRIIKLNLNLTIEASFHLTYQPWMIKILNDIACVRPSQLNILYFYDINASFSLKYKYDTLYNGPICTLHSLYFYQLNLNNKKFCCYDMNGRYLTNEDQSIAVNDLINVNFHSHTTFILFDNQFILIGAQKKFIII